MGCLKKGDGAQAPSRKENKVLAVKNILSDTILSPYQRYVYQRVGREILSQIHVTAETATRILKLANELDCSPESLIIATLEARFGANKQEVSA